VKYSKCLTYSLTCWKYTICNRNMFTEVFAHDNFSEISTVVNSKWRFEVGIILQGFLYLWKIMHKDSSKWSYVSRISINHSHLKMCQIHLLNTRKEWNYNTKNGKKWGKLQLQKLGNLTNHSLPAVYTKHFNKYLTSCKKKPEYIENNEAVLAKKSKII
jgi:hypothetical protein